MSSSRRNRGDKSKDKIISYEIGQGLIGQAAQEKKPIIFKRISEDMSDSKEENQDKEIEPEPLIDLSPAPVWGTLNRHYFALPCPYISHTTRYTHWNILR